MPNSTGGSLLGRYAGRSQSLDVNELQTLWMTNGAPLLESQVSLPGGSIPLQLNIKSRAMQDREMKELMHTVLASAAAQTAEQRPTSRGGAGAMFLCLILAATLIVIACGRR